MIKSLLYFVAAGLCEIGGGYLIWLWLRENKPIWFAAWWRDPNPLWGYTYAATRQLWARVCRIRRSVCDPVYSVGLAGG